MPRSFISGATSYSHQSYRDIVNDLSEWVTSLKKTNESLIQTSHELKQNGYWNSVNLDFRRLLDYATHFFDTCIQEISQILNEMQEEVKDNHVKRLRTLYVTAEALQKDFGHVWHNEYKQKEYNNPNFHEVEGLYSAGRDMAIDLRDLDSLAERLQDFVGKKNDPIMTAKPQAFGFAINLNRLWHKLYFYLRSVLNGKL